MVEAEYQPQRHGVVLNLSDRMQSDTALRHRNEAAGQTLNLISLYK